MGPAREWALCAEVSARRLRECPCRLREAARTGIRGSENMAVFVIGGLREAARTGGMRLPDGPEFG